MNRIRKSRHALALGAGLALAAAAGSAEALVFSLSNTSTSTTTPSFGLSYNKIGDPVKLVLDFEAFGGVVVEALVGSPGSYTTATTAGEFINPDALRIYGTVAGYFSDVDGNFANADGTLCGLDVVVNCFDASNSGAFFLDFTYTGGINFDPKAGPVAVDPPSVYDFDNGAVGDILGQPTLDENTGHPLYTVNQPEPLLGSEDNPGVGSGSLDYLGVLFEGEGLDYRNADPGEDLDNFKPYLTSDCFIDTDPDPDIVAFPDCALAMAISPLLGDQFDLDGEGGLDPVSFALYPKVTTALRTAFGDLGFTGDYDATPDPATQGVYCASPFLNAQGGSLPTDDPNALLTFCSTGIADSSGVRTLPNAGLGPVTLSRFVPEPASLGLLGLALAGLVGVGRRRM